MALGVVQEGRSDYARVGPVSYANTAYAEVGLIEAKDIESISGAVRTNGARRVRISFASNDDAAATFTAHPELIEQIHEIAPPAGTSPLPPTRVYMVTRLASLTGVVGAITGVNAISMPTSSYRWAKGAVTVAGGRTPDNYFSPNNLTTPQDGIAWVEFDVAGAKAFRCPCVCANADKLMWPIIRFYK